MREHGYSERAACRLIGVDRSAFRYERADGGDAALRKRLRELAHQRRRFGYRRLAILEVEDDVFAGLGSPAQADEMATRQDLALVFDGRVAV